MAARSPLLFLACAALLAGCGGTPAPSRAADLCPPAARPQPEPLPLPSAGAPGDVPALLAAVRQARASRPGFTCDAESFETAPAGTGKQTLKIGYKAPRSLRIDVVKGSALSEGAKFVWMGGAEARVKAKLLPWPLTKPITDDMLTSWNGWTIETTSPQGILDSLLDPGAQVRPQGEKEVGGRKLVVLHVTSPKRPKGATYELIGIDPATSLPASREVYQGSKLIYSLLITRMSLAVPAASMFEL